MTICSTAFSRLARSVSRHAGAPDLLLVEVPHPFGGLPESYARALAPQVATGIERLLEEKQQM